jgi:23S rRNA pseudouridine2605 synthase
MSTAAPGGERLNRFLARRGVASRRAADELIAGGRVRVNGAVATVGARVDGNADTVTVDGRRIETSLPAAVTIALNKPAGVVTTMADTHGRATVAGLVPEIAGLAPIGRLDADSRGLLLLTNDGELAHRVAHPRHGVTKTYRVVPDAPLSDQQLARLRDGALLDDGPARPLAVRRVPGSTAVDVIMGEGRKRVVRRLLAAVGNGVSDLCRIAVGPVVLDDLDEGSSRVLDAGELAALRAAVGAAPAP